MYKALFRPLLFMLSPERAHQVTAWLLRVSCTIPGVKSLLASIYKVSDPRLERHLLGLRFPNPVGLAAGFDKDARLIDELACFGFGFIEVGTVTPKAQPGNPKPRLFRLKDDRALINRMGFNNDGAAAAAARLKRRGANAIVGGNVGKNKSTSNEDAAADYATCVEALFPFVDYFVVNVSSPNTPGLRELQERDPLTKILLRVKEVIRSQGKEKPVLLKIAPDLTQEQLDDIVEIVVATGTNGVIATNTTLSRDGLITSAEKLRIVGAGGVSGKPLASRSNEVIRYLRQKLGSGFPIVGVGGVMTPEDAVAKLEAGADLVQVYTGFIYEGPSFARRIADRILHLKV
jgi:dihydroorotate dehydrogenase